MEPGIYSDLTHKDLPPGLSPSGAKTILRSPAQYKWDRAHPKPPSRSMVLGTMVHALVLEGETRYAEIPDRRTKTGKEAEAQARSNGLEPVTPPEREQIEGMAQAVLEHETAANILAVGQPEQAVIWTDDETGVTCRGFIDWLRDNAVVDVKSTQDASPAGFGKQAANLSYDIQSWMYREAIRQLTGADLPFLHICVQSSPPYLVAVHQLPPEADERGERLTREALNLYAECVKTGDWPGYPTDIISTPWPRWA